MSELKPCPFCGAEPMAITDKRDHERMTIECETKGCPAKSLYCSAAAWNRRAPAAPAEPPAPEAPHRYDRCPKCGSGNTQMLQGGVWQCCDCPWTTPNNPAPEAPKMRCEHAISGKCFHRIQPACNPHKRTGRCATLEWDCRFSPTGRARCVEVKP